MTTEEIRSAFLQFFANKGHTAVASSSLIPAGDPTLLFVNAGMVQFKDCFLGTDKRAYTRATTCQKCLRISGKHNDLENVGRTARHHTFFEMLGNFSFGDYFKPDAIKFAWEFLTETIKLPKERLWVTVYEEDDEAAELWRTLTDVQPERILRCGKEDNFWAMGDTGPCGPCSEIHYYLGADLSQQNEALFRKNDGSIIEIWNLVFMQYNRDVTGHLTPLPKPSVDTGAGLERVAAVKQGKLSNYDTDLLRGIIGLVEEMSGKKYDGRDYTERDMKSDPQYAIDVACRVIADHVRACCFLIADGISPSSDGRGYVLRRLLRRACRHGRNLGFQKPFLFQVAEGVVRTMAAAYPELRASEAKIKKLIHSEEEKFLTTLDAGLAILRKEVESVKAGGRKVLSGDVAFLLHDTYGFPLDLTEDIARVDGLGVDHSAFSERMEEQRERSRSVRAGETEQILRRTVKPVPVRFVGYEFTEYESEIIGLFTKEGEVAAAKAGDEVAIITRETPFYGEAGGQVGDTGTMSSNSAAVDVIDTQKVGGETIVHICRVLEGEVTPQLRVRLTVDDERRKKIRAHHSATHLLHYALRKVLGDHVKQAGSRVTDSALRFDFSHFEPISPEQMEEVEEIVNEQIRANYSVATQLMPLDEARNSGAMALFDEKYGAQVRVVQMGPNSKELCGGTHVGRTGDIGFLSLTGEGAISAGVRRIEARAGASAYAGYREQRRLVRELSATLKTGERELNDRVKRLLDRVRDLEKQLDERARSAKTLTGAELAEGAALTSDGVHVVASRIEHTNPKELREMADDLKVRLKTGCIALGGVVDGKLILLTAVTEDLTKRYHAGKLMAEIAKVVGGRGGGRPDLAQSGGGDPEKLDEALNRFRELVA